MSSIVIRIEELCKAYQIGLKEEIPDTFAEAIHSWLLNPVRNLKRLRRLDTSENDGEGILWALRDISLDVREGDVLGIIGRNGAGKSTLLKILSRITHPTSGRAVIHGRVSSLLEVGTGFHPELTGRENVYLNGTILGMKKREIDQKFSEIVDFSGIAQFLDTPMKRYSSGMKVRLAFSVAAHLEPDILIIDEVLAVGDVEFQRKCLGKMESVATQGRTVLFVSHNMPAVRRLTSKCVYLSEGQLNCYGSTGSTIDEYMKDALDRRTRDVSFFRRDPESDSPVRINRIWMSEFCGHDEVMPLLHYGTDITLAIEINSQIACSTCCISITLVRDHEHCVTTLFSKDSGVNFPLRKGRQILKCHLEAPPLSPGTYSVNVGINRDAVNKAFDVLLGYPVFEMECPQGPDGAIDWPKRPWGAVHLPRAVWYQA